MRRLFAIACSCATFLGCGLNASIGNAVDDYYFPRSEDGAPAVVEIEHLGSVPVSRAAMTLPHGIRPLGTMSRSEYVLPDPPEGLELDVKHVPGPKPAPHRVFHWIENGPVLAE